jgi:branched-chain amino acid transport system ATP-binding protein
MVMSIPAGRLSCETLSKSYGGVNALVNVSLEFPSSGVIAIIGPNGAGKTTLLDVIAGFLRPDSGRVFLGDNELTRLPAYRTARLGISRTFQELRLITQISALENVLLGRPNQRGERIWRALSRLGVAASERENCDEAMRWLRFVGLDGVADYPAGTLSYGQQKLLTLACCLATGSQVLLLDEPFSGVHPEAVRRIRDLIRDLRDLEKMIVFIEHDIASVRDVADQVVVMDHGKIIAFGPPSDVLERPEIVEAYVG